MPVLVRTGIRLAPASALFFAAGLLAASTLSAADGALDPDWGGDGISDGVWESNPRSAAVSFANQVLISGRMDQSTTADFEYWVNLSSGSSTWYVCSQFAPLLDNFDTRKILLDSAGNLLFAGTATVFGSETVERAFVARIQPPLACALDTTFSGAGWEYFDDAPFCDTEDCRLVDIEESADATTRYIALLESVQNLLISDYYLVGLTASGALDPNFGSGGFAPVTAGNLGLLASGGATLVVDASNRPYVLLTFYDPNASLDLDTALTRFQSDGDLDTTFGTAGSRFFAVGDSEDTVARSLAIGNDGRIGLAWRSVDGNSSTVMAFEPVSGATAGSVVAAREIRSLAFDGLGRLLSASDVLGGDGLEVGRRIVVFNSTLSPDPAFGVAGVRLVDIDNGGGNTETPVDLQLPSGQPMVLAETDSAAGGKEAVLVRLENSLIFADGFEWGSTKFW